MKIIQKNIIILLFLAGFIFSSCAGFESLSPPENVIATKSEHNRQISVKWDAVSGADYYQIYRSVIAESPGESNRDLINHIADGNGSGTSIDAPGTGRNFDSAYTLLAQKNLIDTNYVDEDLDPGSIYFYRVKALNKSFVESDLSSYDKGTTGTFPDAPGTVIATDGDYTNKVVVSWSAVPDAVSYNVYRSETLDGTYSLMTTQSGEGGSTTTKAEFISDIDLSGNGVYVIVWQTVTVKITIGGVSRSVSFTGGEWFDYNQYNQSDVITKINEAFGEVVCFAVDDKYIKLISYDSPVILENEQNLLLQSAIDCLFQNGNKASETVQVDPVVDDGGGSDKSFTYTDESVVQGTQYYYKIVAVNSDGEASLDSECNNGFSVSPTALSPPSLVTAESGSVGAITVNWTAVADAVSYRVYRSTSSSGLYLQVGNDISSPTLSYTDTTVTSDDTFFFRVSTINSSGEESKFSAYTQGNAEITAQQFLAIQMAEDDYIHAKLDYADPNPGLSTDVTINGDKGGTCHWWIDMQGMGGKASFVFTNYMDDVLVWNGTQTAVSSASGNGEINGTINFSGKYTAYIKYFVQFTNRKNSGGYYLVSYPSGAAEERIEWSSMQ
ncbi:MAG: hypothetical protein GY754_34140 [bacterium]|nr:hypothetical protein [bacterium]